MNLFRISDFGSRISQASVLGFLILAFIPSRAAAHLVTTGMGPVYDGIGHLLLTPEDIVPVLTLALYAGMRGTMTGRRTLFLLPIAWFVGGVAGSMTNGIPPLPVAAVSFLVLGGLVAADLYMPADVVSILAIVIGLVHGFSNGAVIKDGLGALELFGIMIMLFVIVALASAFVFSLKKQWTRIAVRVAGSWIFASGLLMVGWLIRAAK